MNSTKLKIIKSSEKIQNVYDAHTESLWQTMGTDTPVENADTLNGKQKIGKINYFIIFYLIIFITK